VKRQYVPERGDLVWLDFEPHAGHEQAGRRPALALSPKYYNQKTGLGIFCPITSQIRHGSNQGNSSAGRNPVGNASVAFRPAERHGGRSLLCYPDGRQIEPCLKSKDFRLKSLCRPD
jgi:hypothetical protein